MLPSVVFLLVGSIFPSLSSFRFTFTRLVHVLCVYMYLDWSFTSGGYSIFFFMPFSEAAVILFNKTNSGKTSWSKPCCVSIMYWCLLQYAYVANAFVERLVIEYLFKAINMEYYVYMQQNDTY